MEQKQIIAELIYRIEQLKKNCFKNPNPYYNTPKEEWIDLTIKIKELNKLSH